MTPLLEIENLTVTYLSQGHKIYAVQGVDFSIFPGEIIGIVGESGCGKSSIFQGLLKLLSPKTTKVAQDKFHFQGKDLSSYSHKDFRTFLGKNIGWIPQDPFLALNPCKKIGSQLIETLVYHKLLPKKEALLRVISLLEKIGISYPEKRLKQYPHELSGGMRQRILLTMALSTYPSLLIADEPTTALDVTMQKQLLQLFQDIQKSFSTTLVIISHDIGFLANICTRFFVMYSGKIIEKAPTEFLLKNPLHPYTRGLLQATFSLDQKKLSPISGTPPQLYSLKKGCSFAPRCPYLLQICTKQTPPLFKEKKQEVACYLFHPQKKHEKTYTSPSAQQDFLSETVSLPSRK